MLRTCEFADEVFGVLLFFGELDLVRSACGSPCPS